MINSSLEERNSLMLKRRPSQESKKNIAELHVTKMPVKMEDCLGVFVLKFYLGERTEEKQRRQII